MMITLPPIQDPSKAPNNMELTHNSWSKQDRQNFVFNCKTAPEIIPTKIFYKSVVFIISTVSLYVSISKIL